MNDELVLTSPGEESIGPRLARHREARGLTLAAAAAKLHCDESLLRALETERFAEIGARVFVQGHLRRYADLLGAPVDELLAEWSRRGAAAAQPDLTQVPRAPTRAVDPQVWARRIGSAAAALVIAVAAWWILRGGSVATPAPAPSAAPAAASMVPGVPAVAASPAAASVDGLADSPAVVEAPAATMPAVEMPAAALPAAAAPAATATAEPAVAGDPAVRRAPPTPGWRFTMPAAGDFSLISCAAAALHRRRAWCRCACSSAVLTPPR
jgi:cytoskeletal protein RodZ